MHSSSPVVITGQQIGVGWTPALSVVKALTALAEAQRLGTEAVYWLADEDHDQVEVASTTVLQQGRILRHRFVFEATSGMATGWLPWKEAQQREAEALWGELPTPKEPTLRGHTLSLGEPLWKRGIRAFSPTLNPSRASLQEELERWRSLNLEALLIRQAEQLASQGFSVPLDPRRQAAWFSLDPDTGHRRRLAPGEPCSQGHWLSPGATLRPLLQSRLLPVAASVLGPAEEAYWRLTEPLWEKVGLVPPRIIARPTVFVMPKDSPPMDLQGLEALRHGDWMHFLNGIKDWPSNAFSYPEPRETWSEALKGRFRSEMARMQNRLARLDRRHGREQLQRRWGMDPQRLRQCLFPLEKPQERVLPGIYWLQHEVLLDRIFAALQSGGMLHLVEESL